MGEMKFPAAVGGNDPFKGAVGGEGVEDLRMNSTGFVDEQVPDITAVNGIAREWGLGEVRESRQDIDGGERGGGSAAWV